MKVKALPFTAVLAISLALAACSDEPSEPSETESATAEGVVLPGTISDDMIRYERIGEADPPLPAGGAAEDPETDADAPESR
jgi:hypothetical protein